MASTDAKPVPQKNVAYRVTFPILDPDGDLVTAAGSLDSEISKDGGTFADCTNEATEIATSSGIYYLDLTSTEMNADTVAIIVKSAGGKTTPIVMYPEEAGDIRVNATQWNSLTTVALPLVPTTAGRTLDVSATGEAGLDWANIGSPTTANNLSATNIDVDQVVASVSGAVGSVTGLTAATVHSDLDDIQSKIGTPAGASISADILTLDNLVDELETRLGTPSDLGSGATVAANLVDIEAQTDDIGAAGAGLTAVPWNAAWDAEVQSEVQDALEANNLDHLMKIAVDTDFATTVHLNSVIGNIADNGTSATFDRTTDSLEALQAEHDATQSLLGTPAGASISADIAAIEAQTDDIGTAGAGLTAVPWNAAWDAEVQSECTDALTAYDPPTRAELTSDIDTLPTATENADALLKRDWTSVTGEASRSVLNALRFIRNKFSLTASPGDVTVYKEDDTTAAYTKPVTTDGAAEPIVEG